MAKQTDTSERFNMSYLTDDLDIIDAALKENADAIENKPDAADIPAPSTTAPAMDGTGSAGTSSQYARADHVHPSDTSKQNALSSTQLDAVNSGIDSTKVGQIETNKSNILSIYNTGFAQKNVMHIVLDEVKALLSWATFINNTITFGNLAVTFNDDNSITLNGSHTVAVAINFKDLSHINMPTNAVGAASANTTLSNDIFFGLWGDSVPNLVLNDGVDIPSDYASKYSRGFIIRVSANTVCNNVRIYPMVCDKALYQASPEVVPYAMSNAELTDKVETNKNNILTLETMNGAKNKFDYEAWKNCGVFQGTKTINGNSFTIVASGDDCFTWYENGTPRLYPINARIPCNAGDKVVFTWEYTPLSGQTNDRVGIFANGSANSGLFALASANAKKLEFTAPTGTTYFSIRFGVQVAGNSAIYGNIQIQSKASYDAGFTDYQPYAMSNAELTAAIQALQAQLNQ